MAANIAMFFGVGPLPLVGQWGNTVAGSGEPFELTIRSLDPGGASAGAGLRVGDRIDVRTNAPLERFWLLGQPVAGTPVTILALRGTTQWHVTIVPRMASVFRRWTLALIPLGTIWLIVFAAMIAWRRSNVREMRLLCLLLIFYALWEATSPRFFAAQSAWTYVALGAGNVLGTLSVAFWAATAGCFSPPRSRLRQGMQVACYAFIGLSMAIGLARIAAIMTLRVDPLAFSSLWSGVPFLLAYCTATACTVLAVFASAGAERQRALWSLVPPALLIGLGSLSESSQAVVTNYDLAYFLYYAASFLDFFTPLALLYVALNRRLLDVGFVLNRAAVFAIVSAIVIGAFVLAEWAASEWLVSASHTTSAVVGMLVALALGLSLRYIHKYVDRFADHFFFRKRHEDEAALRRFAHESAYITDRTILLDRAIATVKQHGSTDASILTLNGAGVYAVHPPSNGAHTIVGENDPAIVALRAWQKPVDLEKFHDSDLSGQFAFPMASRGTLAGVLVCGSKQDSEVYAPDEADALMTLAHGVGSALGALSAESGNSLAGIARELGALRAILERDRA
jgi:hypothetical protein